MLEHSLFTRFFFCFFLFSLSTRICAIKWLMRACGSKDWLYFSKCLNNLTSCFIDKENYSASDACFCFIRFYVCFRRTWADKNRFLPFRPSRAYSPPLTFFYDLDILRGFSNPNWLPFDRVMNLIFVCKHMKLVSKQYRCFKMVLLNMNA